MWYCDVKSQLQSLRERWELQCPINRVKYLKSSTDGFKINPFENDPIGFWKEYQKKHGTFLSKYAFQSLSRPATSCSSERCFKSAGFLYTAERSNLDISNVEKMVFIRENLHILPKNSELYEKLKEFKAKNTLKPNINKDLWLVISISKISQASTRQAQASTDQKKVLVYPTLDPWGFCISYTWLFHYLSFGDSF